MSIIDHKLHVFLCHAKEDKPIVRNLHRQLTVEGWMDVWLDEIKLLPGQEWDIEIEKAVEQADVVIVCLSNKSVDKEGYIQKELRFVLNIADEKPEGTIFVVPLRLDDCAVPRRIRAWQYVDYFPNANQKWAYQRLIESLKLRAVKLEIPFEDARVNGELEKKAKEERERTAAQKKEAERIELERIEKERRAKENRERIAAQNAEVKQNAGEVSETEEGKVFVSSLGRAKFKPNLRLGIILLSFFVGGYIILNLMGIRLPNGSPITNMFPSLFLVFSGIWLLGSWQNK